MRLAADIKAEITAAERDFESAVAHAIKAGELLLEAKANVDHGGWLAWLEANFPGSIRSAQGYMRLARNAADAQALAHLGIEGALKQLASSTPRPSEPDVAFDFGEIGAREAKAPRRENFDEGDGLDEFRYLEAKIAHATEMMRAPFKDMIRVADTIEDETIAAVARRVGTLGLLRIDLEDEERFEEAHAFGITLERERTRMIELCHEGMAKAEAEAERLSSQGDHLGAAKLYIDAGDVLHAAAARERS